MLFKRQFMRTFDCLTVCMCVSVYVCVCVHTIGACTLACVRKDAQCNYRPIPCVRAVVLSVSGSQSIGKMLIKSRQPRDPHPTARTVVRIIRNWIHASQKKEA